MNKLFTLQMALCEKYNADEITLDELETLFEKAEERYQENLPDTEMSEDEESIMESVMDGYMTVDEGIDLFEEAGEKEKVESANKIYINAFKKLVNEYKDEIKGIESTIKSGNQKEAIKRIEKCKKSLLQLKELVNKTPTTLKDTTISLLIPLIASISIINLISKAINFVIIKKFNTSKVYKQEQETRKKLDKVSDEYTKGLQKKNINPKDINKIKEEMEILKEEDSKLFNKWGDLLNKQGKILNKTNKILNTTEDGILIGSGVAVISKINFFKSITIKKINLELKHLQKIESMIK